MTIHDKTEEANPKLLPTDLPVFNDKCRERSPDQSTPRVITSLQEVAEAKGILPTPPIDSQQSQSQSQTASAEPHQHQSNNTTNNEGGGGAAFHTLPLDGEILEDGGYATGLVDETEARPQSSAYRPPMTSIVAGPLRNIQYSQVKDRTTLIEQLNKSIPRNEYNLPLYLYRADMLDYTLFQTLPSSEDAGFLQELLSSATVNISYTQGFPSFLNALPIWAKLDWEPETAYIAFTEYLEQQGVRSLHKMHGSSTHLSTVRASPKDLYDQFTQFYWGVRARAFDLYQAAHAQRARIDRVMSTQDNHYELSSNLLKKVVSRINSLEEDDWLEVGPKEAIDMVDKLTKIQRISVGLPATGPLPSKEQAPAVQSTEQQMLRLANSELSAEQIEQQLLDQAAAAANDAASSEEIDLLRDRPDLVDEAQGLILKLVQGPNISSPSPSLENGSGSGSGDSDSITVVSTGTGTGVGVGEGE
jgi:hypothetical protein